MKYKTHKLEPSECEFCFDVDTSEEYDNKPVVFIIPFDEYHKDFDNLRDSSLSNPPSYLVNGDWIMENTCVIEDMSLEEVKDNMIKLGFVYNEELL